MPLEDEDSIWVVVNEEKKIYTEHVRSTLLAVWMNILYNLKKLYNASSLVRVFFSSWQIVLFTRLDLLTLQVIPVSTPAQPLSLVPATPSGASSGVKPASVLVSFCFV